MSASGGPKASESERTVTLERGTWNLDWVGS